MRSATVVFGCTFSTVNRIKPSCHSSDSAVLSQIFPVQVLSALPGPDPPLGTAFPANKQIRFFLKVFVLTQICRSDRNKAHCRCFLHTCRLPYCYSRICSPHPSEHAVLTGFAYPAVIYCHMPGIRDAVSCIRSEYQPVAVDGFRIERIPQILSAPEYSSISYPTLCFNRVYALNPRRNPTVPLAQPADVINICITLN